MLEAIAMEIDYTCHRIQNEEGVLPSIETLYFGGGTPSLLEEGELQFLMDRITRHFTLDPGAEITLEANPDDFSASQAGWWRKAGINRLSIGIQSFRDEDLQWMHRTHRAEKARQAIELAIQAGFSNLSVDLIYGIPGLKDEDWMDNINRVLDYGISHVACYALTVEPRTALSSMIAAHKKEPVDPEGQARQFLLLMEAMEAAGYEHYEISNFAKPGWRSRHNSSYWQGKPYYGFGPSAHSYNGQIRGWNIANNALYIKSLQHGAPDFEMEILKESDRLNEYVMTSLRTMEGLDLDYVEDRFSPAQRLRLENESAKYLDRGWMVREGQNLQLTKNGKLFADAIASDLFLLQT